MSIEVTAFADILAELAKPFDPVAVEFKPGAVAKNEARALALAYVDSREYMHRLDAVDPTWSDAYEVLEGATVVCRLTVAGVTRTDLGRKDEADENSLTSAAAQAFKRACTKFGLGRYLYALPQTWAEFDRERKRFTPAALDTLRAMLMVPTRPVHPLEGNDHHPGMLRNGGNGPEVVKLESPKPAVIPPPSSGNGSNANNGARRAAVKTGKWAQAAQALVDRCPCYAKAGGAPDGYLLTTRALDLGYPQITDANLADVVAALEQAAAVTA